MQQTIISLLTVVSRATKEAVEQRLQGYGVHAGQQFILQLLWETKEPLTVGDIAFRIGVEDPTITRAVQRMARQGLVKRSAHPTDARCVIVELTPRGREMQALIPSLLAGFEEQLLQNISDIEHILLLRLLGQMIQNLNIDAEGRK